MADLLVKVGADISQFNKAMSDVETGAKTVANDVSKNLSDAAMNTEKLGGSALSASMRFQQMRSGISAARDGVLAFTLSGQSADRSLMAMGHHITSLVNETGSFKGAMSALASSLWGAGGLILGITLAMELWDKYSKAQEKAKKGGEEYINTLGSVDQALLKGAQAGENETVRLGILYNATQNHALSLKDRNKAYDELASKYPQFFSNADREKTLLGENTVAYDKLRDAILAAAMAKSAEEQIGKNDNRKLENLKKGTDLAVLQAKAQTDLSKAQKSIKEDRAAGLPESTYDQAVVASRTKTINDLIKQQNNLKTDSNKLDKQNNDLTAIAATNENKAGYKTAPEDSKKDTKAKEAKTYLQQLEDQFKKLQSVEDEWIAKGNTFEWWNPTKTERALMQLQTLIDAAKEANNQLGKIDGTQARSGGYSMNTATGKTKTNVPITEVPLELGTVEGVQKMAKAYLDLSNKQAQAAAEQSLYNKELKESQKIGQDIVRTFGHGLMNAFESAMNGTKSFVQAMSQFLTQLIEKLIAAAIAAAVLAALLSATGFGAALGMGSDATSFVGLFSQLAGMGGGSKHASGGIFTQAHVGTFAEAGPEAIVTPQHLADFAGVAQGGGSMKVEPFQIGATMWFKQTQRTNKYINRTS
jgi:hypothetical protein